MVSSRNLADDWPPLRTFTDIALRHWNVRLTCPECQYERVLHGAALWWLFHRKHWPDDVRSGTQRLYCSRCRHTRGVKIIPWIKKTKDDATGKALPLPDDREWKRLIARYRS